MAMVHKAQLPADELVQAVGQLSLSELDQFVAQILALHARRRGPSLPRAEADLLLQINQGLPRALQARYGESPVDHCPGGYRCGSGSIAGHLGLQLPGRTGVSLARAGGAGDAGG